QSNLDLQRVPVAVPATRQKFGTDRSPPVNPRQCVGQSNSALPQESRAYLRLAIRTRLLSLLHPDQPLHAISNSPMPIKCSKLAMVSHRETSLRCGDEIAKPAFGDPHSTSPRVRVAPCLSRQCASIDRIPAQRSCSWSLNLFHRTDRLKAPIL